MTVDFVYIMGVGGKKLLFQYMKCKMRYYCEILDAVTVGVAGGALSQWQLALELCLTTPRLPTVSHNSKAKQRNLQIKNKKQNRTKAVEGE